MAEVRTPGLKDRLWHRLRADLAHIAPALASDDRLICCCCGRLLPFDAFSLEHIIPQQALADDPAHVKAAVPLLQRSGATLLCNVPLREGGRLKSATGCNSWKGKNFDRGIREAFKGRVNKSPSNHVIISMMMAAFLAAFSKYGYQIALSSSGLLLRRQFFSPRAFLDEMPLMCQMLLMGQMPAFDPASPKPWVGPFNFGLSEPGRCTVAVRSVAVTLPISRDPRVPIATSIVFVPSKYSMRPDFRAFFD